MHLLKISTCNKWPIKKILGNQFLFSSLRFFVVRLIEVWSTELTLAMIKSQKINESVWYLPCFNFFLNCIQQLSHTSITEKSYWSWLKTQIINQRDKYKISHIQWQETYCSNFSLENCQGSSSKMLMINIAVFIKNTFKKNISKFQLL